MERGWRRISAPPKIWRRNSRKKEYDEDTCIIWDTEVRVWFTVAPCNNLCRAVPNNRIFDRWFEYPVGFFSGSNIRRKNAASTENNVYVEFVCLFFLLAFPSLSPTILLSTFGRHLASPFYSQYYLLDVHVGQDMSGLIWWCIKFQVKWLPLPARQWFQS